MNTSGTPKHDGLSEPPSPLPAPGTPLQKDEIKGSSSPDPEPGSSTPPGQDSERAVDEQVLIPVQPDVFQKERKTEEQHGRTPTILVPNLSDTMRQTAIEAKNRNQQMVTTTFGVVLLLVGLSYLVSTLLDVLNRTGFETLKEGDQKRDE